MKTHFQNNEIAHIWANLTDDELNAGREGRANSMNFRGPMFRSYQTAIAHLVGALRLSVVYWRANLEKEHAETGRFLNGGSK